MTFCLERSRFQVPPTPLGGTCKHMEWHFSLEGWVPSGACKHIYVMEWFSKCQVWFTSYASSILFRLEQKKKVNIWSDISRGGRYRVWVQPIPLGEACYTDHFSSVKCGLPLPLIFHVFSNYQLWFTSSVCCGACHIDFPSDKCGFCMLYKLAYKSAFYPVHTKGNSLEFRC